MIEAAKDLHGTSHQLVPQIYNWCAQIMSQHRTVEVRYTVETWLH